MWPSCLVIYCTLIRSRGRLSCIHLNEDETTSSSRIFIKILVQEMAEAMGMVTLKQRFDTDNPDPDGLLATGGEETAALAIANNTNPDAASSREWFKGMFPKDNARNTRYAINFFTSIGLGPLTDGMREFLKNAPKLILAQAQAQAQRKRNKRWTTAMLPQLSRVAHQIQAALIARVAALFFELVVVVYFFFVIQLLLVGQPKKEEEQ
ncbi:pre-mRNA-splicing factor CWC22 [Skeletonema marinoi]|uniref:Pre-mRNA-splicing factor CWC22 n=1 Tax=Skeletonema marinoi TaxID=267567 RepID=A0AAD8YE88_9STRA|nr:pre-mRNA-splicing factor CWC22 [Skeletonema marinoi]